MNEKIKALKQHLQNIKNRLEEPVPEKHQHRPEQYKTFLKREIALTERGIEKLSR